ncbi:MAG: hypothetical protein IJD98_01300 [Oscillospiraceae bacterium]|nr:hypothetical protein [Oscillospiraceae bacterium]
MKKLLLVLACLLLCGCARNAPDTPDAPPLPPPETTVPVETRPLCWEDTDHPLLDHYPQGLDIYPLSLPDVHTLHTMGEQILLLSGQERTTLTLLGGEDLTVVNTATLDFPLEAGDPSLQITAEGLSFYDPMRQQSVLMTPQLQESRRIYMTESITGSPLLSDDRATLYYCTGSAIRARELESGIHRTVKELSYDRQTIIGTHLSDTVLQCRIQDGDTVRTLFLSAQTGQLLSQQEGAVSLVTQGDKFYASLPVSELDMLIYGQTGTVPQILYPEDLSASHFYLPRNHCLVTASLLPDGQVRVCCYCLESGTLSGTLVLPAMQVPKAVDTAPDGSIVLLAYDPDRACDILYRWNPSAPVFAPESTDAVYALPYQGTAAVNAASLDQCRDYANTLSEKYGLRFLLGEDALTVQPWDYQFEAETLPQILAQELKLLDQRLRRYPQTVIDQTRSHFSSLTLCLVRQITGTAASGSLETATGIQFLEESDAYVVLSVGKYAEQALYHELFHVMETHILTESSALDEWSRWNPPDFDYTYGHTPADVPDSCLSGSSRSFVDAYSMTFPKEDRARIFEAAMLPGNEDLFAAENLQGKLTALCEGIRQAYRLRKSPDTFPWEQYLRAPLACSP